MYFININDILVKHWILFDYDVNKKEFYIKPHFLFKIKESIHYKALVSNDFKYYNLLIKTTDQKEHSENCFLDLKNNFNESLLEKEENKINVFFDENLEKYIVLDGCHRLAILIFKNKNLTKIPINWFKINKK